MSALLSRTRPSIPLVRVKALCKHPIRCVSLLGQETVPLAFDKIETSKTHNTQHDHHHSKHTGAIVFVHGLFGSKQNWRSIGKVFADKLRVPVYAVDLRNHGASPHERPMTHQAMAADLLAFLKNIQSQHSHHHPTSPSAKTYPGIKPPITIVGHSLGGKTAMALALHPDLPDGLIGHLVVEDVSPNRVKLGRDFYAYIKGMKAVLEQQSGSRKEADMHLTEKLAGLKKEDPTIDTSMEIRQFLLTNLAPEPKNGGPMSFRIPLDIIEEAIPNFGDFLYSPGERIWGGPTLAIRGKRSEYIRLPEDQRLFRSFFPDTTLTELDAGHWVHSQDPHGFVREVLHFITNNPPYSE